jgi:hypothetical protein
MRHLSRDEWLALVEADEPPARHQHLDACPTCRDEVSRGRALLAGMRQMDVPEPSPLFWDHFSARVAAGLGATPAPVTGGWPRWRILAPLTVGVGALVLSVAVERGHLRSAAPLASRSVQTVVDAPLPDAGAPDDGQWQLLSHMAGDFDVDTLSDSLGRSPATETETAVWQLNEQERAELTRLLRAELQPGPSGS